MSPVWAVKLTSLHTLELAELAPGAATLSTPLVQSLATRGGTAAGGARPAMRRRWHWRGAAASRWRRGATISRTHLQGRAHSSSM